MSGSQDDGSVLPHRPGAPGNRAVALSDTDGPAIGPTVVATGAGFLADRIVEEALKSGVPVRTDADLVQILAETEVGEEVPVEAFVALAEVLRYVYDYNRAANATRDDAVQGSAPIF